MESEKESKTSPWLNLTISRRAIDEILLVLFAEAADNHRGQTGQYQHHT